jgi:hypothetical protein
MNRFVALAGTFLTCANAAFAAGLSSVLSAKGPLALKVEQAPLLFEQCSRSAPNPEGPLWVPTAAEVKSLETQLEKHMSTIKLGARGNPAAGKQYQGQYIGFVRGNVKHIYAAYVEASEKHPLPVGDAIRICDGGQSDWGIVYNTATGEFSELKVSGTR